MNLDVLTYAARMFRDLGNTPFWSLGFRVSSEPTHRYPHGVGFTYASGFGLPREAANDFGPGAA